MKISSASCWLLVSLFATGCTPSDDANEPTDSASDSDGDGYTVEDGDCDDENNAIHPDAVEACDGMDNDCDELIDDEDESLDATTTTTWYLDSDDDGYGLDGTNTEACDAPSGFTADNSDCDDDDANTHPNADEICDGADNDCDNEIDEDAIDATTWHPDVDGDGYGDPDTTVTSCDQPSGHVADDTDCDDTSASTYPGAVEVCDGLDNDCDDVLEADEGDSDGDGYFDCEDCEEGECYQLNGLYSAADFDVAHDGSVTVVGVNSSGEIYAECFHASGAWTNSVLIETVDVSIYNGISVVVGRAAETHESAIGWHFYNNNWSTVGYDWQTRRAHLNADCEVMAGPEKLDTALGDEILRKTDVEISDEGISAYVYENQSANQFRLVMFDANGALIDAVQFGATQCSGGATGRVLGMNRATGDVIVGCELGAGTGRHYQRFNAAAVPIDATMVEVADAVSSTWSYFGTQMNDDGDFVFLARDSDDVWVATFYDATGTINSVVETALTSTTSPVPRIIVSAAGDFILGGNSFREGYSSNGVWMGESSAGSTVRVDGADIVYTVGATEILFDPFPLYE